MHAFAGRMRKGADMLSSFCSALFSRFRVAVAALFIALLVFLFMLLAPSSAYATTYDSDVQANSPPVDVAEIATEETNAVTSDDDSTEVTVVSGDENSEIVNSASDLQKLENDESQEENTENDSTQANESDTDEGETLDSNTTESDEDRAIDDVNNDVDDNNTSDSADDGEDTDSDSAVDTTTNDSNESADHPAETSEEDVVAITTPDQERDYQSNATAETGANTETAKVAGQSSSALDSGGEGNSDSKASLSSEEKGMSASATGAFGEMSTTNAKIVFRYMANTGAQIYSSVTSGNIKQGKGTATAIEGAVFKSDSNVFALVNGTYVHIGQADSDTSGWGLNSASDLETYYSKKLPTIVIPGYKLLGWRMYNSTQGVTGASAQYLGTGAAINNYPATASYVLYYEAVWGYAENAVFFQAPGVSGNLDTYNVPWTSEVVVNESATNGVLVPNSDSNLEFDGWYYPINVTIGSGVVSASDLLNKVDRKDSSGTPYYLNTDLIPGGYAKYVINEDEGIIPTFESLFSQLTGFSYTNLDTFMNYKLFFYPVFKERSASSQTFKYDYKAGTNGEAIGEAKDEGHYEVTIGSSSSSAAVLAKSEGDALFVRTGYTLVGWNTKADGTGTPVAFGARYSTLSGEGVGTTANQTYTLYAQWASKTYTVQFYNSDPSTNSPGTVISEATGTYNYETNTITFPSGTNIPSRSGYTFAGWLTGTTSNYSNDVNKLIPANGASGGYSYTVKDLIARDTNSYSADTLTIPVFAYWTSNLTITYAKNADDASGDSYSQSVSQGGSVDVLENQFNRTGYTFSKWNTAANGSGTDYSPHGSISPNESVTLYAQWAPRSVTITYNYNDGSATTETTASTTTGTAVTLPTPTRTGYSLIGWDTTQKIASSTATATYNEGSYTPTPTGAGVSWTDTPAKVKLYAVWAPISYTVRYNGNGSTSGSTASSTHYFDKADKLTSNGYSRTSYTFNGWNTAADGSGTSYGNGESVTNLSSTANATVDLYAQWKEELATITYSVGEGISIRTNGSSDSYGSTTITEKVGVATGHIYSSDGTTDTGVSIHGVQFQLATGYGTPTVKRGNTTVTTGVSYTSGDTTGTFVPTTYSDANYVISASKAQYNYLIYHYKQNINGVYDESVASLYEIDGQNNGTLSATYGTTILASNAKKTYTGFSYDQSKTEASENGSGQLIIGADTALNILKIYYTRNSNKVDASYAYTTSSADIPTAADAALPTSVTTTNRGPVNTGSAGGTIMFEDTVTIATPTAPEGYEFLGWTGTYGADGTGNALTITNGTFTMPDGKVKLTGRWKRTTYTVEYVNSSTQSSYGTLGYKSGSSLTPTDGTGPFTIQVLYGDKPSAAPTTTGSQVGSADTYYVFTGWEVVDASNTPILSNGQRVIYDDPTSELTVTGTIRLMATWAMPVVVTYAPGEFGTFTSLTSSQISQNASGTYDVPAFASLYGSNTGFVDTTNSNPRNANNPAGKLGYTFAGWKDDSDRVYSADSLPSIVTRTTIFTATWTPTTQLIVFQNTGKDSATTDSNVTGTWNTSTYSSGLSKATGESIVMPTGTDISIAGYTLTGWKATYSSYDNSGTVVTGSHTLTPGQSWTVTFGDSDNDSGIYGSSDPAGYGVTFAPIFTQDTVQITYAFADDSSGMGAITLVNASSPYANGTALQNVPAITATAANVSGATATQAAGYTFKGWYLDAAHTQAVDSTVTSATVSDITITPQKISGAWTSATYYAYFEPMTFQVTFKITDGHGTLDNTNTNVVTTYVYDGTSGNSPVAYGTDASTLDVVSKVAGLTGYSTSPTYWTWEIDQTQQDGSAGSAQTTGSASTLSGVKITGTATLIAFFDPKAGYTVMYDTHGGSPSVDNKSVYWSGENGKIYPSKTVSKSGYDFVGWSVDASNSDSRNLVTSATTFGDAAAAYVALNPSTSIDSVTVLTIHAIWTPKSGYKVSYDGNGYEGTIASPRSKDDSGNDITWSTTGILPKDLATLSRTGYTFGGWFVKDTNVQVTNDLTYGSVRTTANKGDDPAATLELVAKWTADEYTLRYVNSATETVEPNKVWASTTVKLSTELSDSDAFVYNRKPTQNGYSFMGWLYTNSDGNRVYANFDNNSGKALTTVRDLAGSTTLVNGSVLTVTAVWQKNASYSVEFYTIDVDDSGNRSTPVKDTSATSYTGVLTPSASLDATNLDGNNFTGSSVYSKAGYKYDYTYINDDLGTTVEAIATGGDYIIKVYWVEKTYTVAYNANTSGVDANKSSVQNPSPDTKTGVSWNSTDWAPAVSPSAVGYDLTWTYNGNTIADGAELGSFIGDAADGSTVTLVANWTPKTATITYVTDPATSGTITTPAGGTASITNVITGAGLVGATVTYDADSFVFDGWYYTDSNGAPTRASTSTTFTPQASEFANGIFTDRTYTAKFHDRNNSVPYKLTYMLQDENGGSTYAVDSTHSNIEQGVEGANIDADSAGYKITISGYTLDTSITGTNLSITNLQTVENASDMPEIILYYTRNYYSINPSVTYEDASAGISELSGSDITSTPEFQALGTGAKYYGTTHYLPSVTVPNGWNLQWKMTYTDESGTTQTRTFDNGGTFTVPAAQKDSTINLVAEWTRATHTVTFASPNSSIVTIPNATASVKHGMNMTAAQYDAVKRSIVITGNYVITKWSYKANGTSDLSYTTDPTSVTINRNMTFTAVYEATYTVTYDPLNNGSSIFSDAVSHAGLAINSTLNSSDSALIIGGENYLDADFTEAQKLAAAGYRFLGWSWYDKDINEKRHYYGTAPEGVTNDPMPLYVDTNYTFEAIWEPIEYTLSFLTGSATDPDPVWDDGASQHTATLEMEATTTNQFPTSARISRTGYKLDGWNLADASGNVTSNVIYNAGTPYTLLTAPASESTPIYFVPHWSFDGATIQFVVVGHGTVSVSSVIVTTDEQHPTSTATANQGYNFKGWYAEQAETTLLSNDALAGIALSGDGNSVITLSKPSGSAWEPKTYYAIFEAGDTTYVVEYYLQDANGNYGSTASSTKTFNGTSEASVSFNAATQGYGVKHGFTSDDAAGFTQYAHASQVLTIDSLDPTGASVMKVYYERKAYEVTVSFAGDNQPATNPINASDLDSVNGQSFLHGSVVELPGTQYPGYTLTWTAKLADGTDEPVAVDSDGTFTMPIGAVSVTGTWAAATYNVYYKDNIANTVGTVGSNTSYGYTTSNWGNGTVAVPADAELPGYTFVSWTIMDGSSNATVYSTSTADLYKALAAIAYPGDAADEDALALAAQRNGITLIANFVAKTYYLAFDMNAGTDEISNEPAGGEVVWTDRIVPTTNPARIGYSFGSWTATVDIENSNSLTGLTTSSTTLTFDSIAALLDALGYTGGDLADEFAGKTITLTANWDSAAYTVTYANGNTNNSAYTTVTWTQDDYPDTFRSEWSATGIIPADEPTRTGYTVKEWVVANERTGYEKTYANDGTDYSVLTYAQIVRAMADASDAATVDEITLAGNVMNITVTPVWQAISNNIDFFITDSQADPSSPAEWVGYSPANKAEVDEVVTLPGRGNVHSAGRSLKSWTVSYVDADGVTHTDTITVPDSGNPTFTMPAVQTPTTSVTFTAVWGDVTYTVKYDFSDATDAGTAVASRETKYNATDLNKSDDGTVEYKPIRKGYTFIGWTYGDSDTDYVGTTAYSAIAGSDTVESITLKAKWKANTYTVTFDGNGATSGSMSDQTVTYDDFTTKLDANQYRIPGKSFRGWAASEAHAAEGKVDFGDGATLDANLVDDAADDGSTPTTLYAIWGDVTYTVNYDFSDATDAGNAVASRGTKYNATDLHLSADGDVEYKPIRKGYTFIGWTYGDSDTVYVGTTAYSAIAGSDTVESITLKAKWKPITYTVSFNANGGTGEAMGEQGMTYDAESTLPTNTYTNTGKKFLGWSTDPAATEAKYTDGQTKAFNLADTQDDPKTLYAVWGDLTYTVHYDTDGGSAVADRTGVTWETTGLNTDGATAYAPTKMGYDFEGWNIDDSTKYVNQSYGDIASDDTVERITLKAIWTPKTQNRSGTAYTVVYRTSGSAVPDATNLNWISKDFATPTTGKKGYDFEGWFTDFACTSQLTNDMTYGYLVGNNDEVASVTVYAKLTPITYTVSFDANTSDAVSGTMTPQTMTYDVERNLTKNAFTRDGYTWVGWNTAADGSGIAFADAEAVLNLRETKGDDYPLYAQWKKNVELGIKFYKETASNTFVESVEYEVPCVQATTTWTSYEGQTVTATVTENNGSLVLTVKDNDDNTLGTLTLPVVTGYDYDSTKGRFSLGALIADQAYNFALAYMPKTGSNGVAYKVEYYNGSDLISSKDVNWATAGLNATAPQATQGYKFVNWATANGATVGIDDSDKTYGDLAVEDTVTTVKLFAAWIEREYHINYVDSTDINGNDLTADNYKYIVSSNDAKNPAASTDTMKWADAVTLYGVTDERLVNTLHQTGWKFMGWALSAEKAKAGKVEVSDGRYFNELFIEQNSSIANDDTLATYDVDSDVNNEGLFLYAVWAKYVPYVVKYYTTDGTEEKLVTSVTHDASEKGAYLGGTTTVGDDDIDEHRPAGYRLLTVTLQNTFTSEDANDNVIEVWYTLYTEYKLNFDKNAPGATASDIKYTLTDLTWASTPYNASTGFTPTLQGYTLNGMPSRWNTKRDGTGLTFTSGTTYAQIAQAIAEAAGTVVNDVAIRDTGLTLYAQWEENEFYKVLYDLNNDKDKNTNVLTGVPSTLTPIDTDTLTKDPVKWTASGFNDSRELNAAPYGYEFAGWNTARDGSGLTVLDATKYSELSNAVSPNEEQKSVTLYAQWKELVITITYTTDGNGTVDRTIDKVSVVTGKPVGTGSSSDNRTLTSTATAKAGYHFVKWVLVSDGSSTGGLTVAAITTSVGGENNTDVDGTKLTVLKGDDGLWHAATYQALFEANDDATLVYDANGGTGSVDSDVEPFGSLLTLSSGSTLKRSYYTLKGWNTKADGTGTTYALNQADYELPEGTTTLYAMWDANEYVVTIGGDTEGGTVAGTIGTVKYGDKVSSDTVTSASATPATGKRLAYWTYEMIDGETGELVTGKVSDPSELEIKGSVTFTPVFEDDPDYVDPSKTASGTDATKGAPADTGELLPQTGDGNAMPLLLVVALLAAFTMVFAARRRHENSSNDPPTPGSPRRGSRTGSMALGIAVAVLITTGTALAPDEALALGDDEQATAITEHQNAAENAEAESNDSASDLYAETGLVEPAGGQFDDALDSTVDDMQEQDALPVIADGEDDPLVVVESDGEDAAEGDEGDEPKSEESDDEDPSGDVTDSGDADTSQNERTEAAGTQTPSNEVTSAPEATEPQDEVQEDTEAVEENIERQMTAERPRLQLRVPDEVEIASLGISIASITVEPVESDFQEGQYFLKEFVNEQAALAVANGKVVAAGKEATGVSNHWDIYRVAGSTDKSLFTIKCGELYLAYENGQLFLTATPGESAQWHIASYMLAGNPVIAIYSASMAAVLGVSGDVTHVPFCMNVDSDTYPSLPVSKELRWIPESVKALSWTITLKANDGTGATSDVQVEGGESSPALKNPFTRAGYTFEGWRDSDGETYADGAVIERELYVSNYTLTLTAQWKENSVQVVYEAGNGGTVQLGTGGASAARLVETVGAATGIVPGTASQTFSGSRAVANRGYHFVGWKVSGVPSAASKTDLSTAEKDSTTLTGSTVSELSLASDADASDTVYHALTFISSFTANIYTLSYDINGGLGEFASTSAAYGGNSSVASASSVALRDGYVFSGWNTQADGSGVSVADGATLSVATLDKLISSGAVSASGDDSTTLFAQWTAIPTTDTVAGEDDGASTYIEASTNTAPANVGPVAEAMSYVLPTAGALLNEAAVVADEAASAVADAAKEVGEALQVTPVSATPIVTAAASTSWAGGSASADGVDAVEAFANMSSTEKVQVAGNVVTTLAAVSAVAGLLGVGVPVVAAFVAGIVGVAGTAGATGAADLAAELAAASTAGGVWSRIRRRFKGGAAAEDTDEGDDES